MDGLLKKIGVGVILGFVSLVSGCGGRAYFGANDPVLSYEENKEVIGRDFEDAKRTQILEEIYPLTLATYKF